jgi:hypothetical protein
VGLRDHEIAREGCPSISDEETMPDRAGRGMESIAGIDQRQIPGGVDKRATSQWRGLSSAHRRSGASVSARYSYFLLESVGGASVAEPMSLVIGSSAVIGRPAKWGRLAFRRGTLNAGFSSTYMGILAGPKRGRSQG